MKIPTMKHIKGNTYEFPFGHVPFYYFDALNLLHKFENSLRLFVYAILKSEYCGDWVNTKLKQDEERTILHIYKRRKNELESYGHIGALPDIPLLYLTLDELVAIILNVSLRLLFKRHFPASIDKIYKTKFWEVIILRNNLVHFRKFKKSDFDKLAYNLKELSIPIADYLCKMKSGNFEKLTPTKKDVWHSNWLFTSLKPMKDVSFNLYMSECKRWIKLILTAKVLKKEGRGFVYYNVDSKKISHSIQNILPYMIYFSYGYNSEVIIPEGYETQVTVCLHPRQLNNHHADIFSFFIELIDCLNKEFHTVSLKDFSILSKKSFKYLEYIWEKDYKRITMNLFHEDVRESDFAEDWSGYVTFPDLVELWRYDSPWIK